MCVNASVQGQPKQGSTTRIPFIRLSWYYKYDYYTILPLQGKTGSVVELTCKEKKIKVRPFYKHTIQHVFLCFLVAHTF